MILAQTPLATRIERWATSGKATRIPLHPSDYWILDRAGLIDKVSDKYKLDITCLGGENALKKFLKENTKEGNEEDGS